MVNGWQIYMFTAAGTFKLRQTRNCSANTCTASQVSFSNKATSLSITGTTGATVAVTCNAGYSGGGTWTCGTNGHFTGSASSANNCTATQVGNSTKANTGSITGTTGATVNVTCNAGYSGGGTWTCGCVWRG